MHVCEVRCFQGVYIVLVYAPYKVPIQSNCVAGGVAPLQ